MSVNPSTVSNLSAYANYVAKVLLADQVGTVATIPNALASQALDTTLLVDPLQIEAYKQTVADQMNKQTGSVRFEDLSERIADVQIQDVTQGAGTLTVSIIDPHLHLGNSGFITTDENGYLWPPIEINFPLGTDCWWTLVNFSDSTDFTQANLTLTFEDRIASFLRRMNPVTGNVRQGRVNQSLGDFFAMLVADANAVLKPNPPIRFVPLLDPLDPNYTPPITSLPASAAKGLRKNPNKDQHGLTPHQKGLVDKIDKGLSKIFGDAAGGIRALGQSISGGSGADLLFGAGAGSVQDSQMPAARREQAQLAAVRGTHPKATPHHPTTKSTTLKASDTLMAGLTASIGQAIGEVGAATSKAAKASPATLTKAGVLTNPKVSTDNLTVKGAKITSDQLSVAQTLLAIGTSQHAPLVAKQACIFDAIFESELGVLGGWSSQTYGGVLGGSKDVFGQYGSEFSLNVTNAEARSFYQGGNGYQAGGAIHAASTYSDPSLLGPQVTAPFDGSHPPPYGQYLDGGLQLIRQVKAEAIAICAAIAGGTGITGGGTFGLGGTGTPANAIAATPWEVGSEYNPDQDYWTTMNQYAQNAQLYFFSDGETLYLADGLQLLAQTPVAVIVRISPPILQSSQSYDNSSWTYVATHTMKGKIVRRAALAKIMSPTQVTLRIVCDIDEFRGGDTVYLKLFGPSDGIWLVANKKRSPFLPYSDLTLLQGVQPLNATSGLPVGNLYETGKAASKAGAGTVLAHMISEAATIDSFKVPYVWGGGHTAAGVESVGVPGGNGYDGHTVGFDCSGSVGAVLAAGGLLQWHGSVPGSSGIVDLLLSQQKVRAGSGTMPTEVTLYDSPDHIFMRINGQFWGTADASGHLPSNGAGVGWIHDGVPATNFRITHVPVSILGQQATGTYTGGGG